MSDTPKDFTLNNATQGMWQVSLSNLPFDTSNLFKDIDIRRFNNFVKATSFPESILNLQQSHTARESRLFVMPSFNKELPEFTVTYGLDENMSNYWYLFNWLWNGRNASSMNTNKWLVDAKINEATLQFKDNNGRCKNFITFTDCYVSNLSGMDFMYGAFDDLTFTVTFKFNGFNI